MILALAPPMAVLSLGTTRLMQTSLQRQAGVTLDYATAQNAIAINRDLSDLRALVDHSAERIEQAVSAALAEGAVGDLLARGEREAAGARLAAALEPAGASMITVLDRRGFAIARATDPGTYGDPVLWPGEREAEAYVTDLRRPVRTAFAGRELRGALVLSAAALRTEKVTSASAIAGLTTPADRLSDQAWILLESGRTRESRGLAMAALLPVRDRGGAIRGVALAAQVMNRNPKLAQAYRRVTGRWMAACLGGAVVQGDLPTQRRAIVGALMPAELARPILKQGKQRWTGRLDSTGIELNAAASALRDVNGNVVGMLVTASPVTELQRVVDNMQADAARLQSRALLALLVWISVGTALALVLAALAARGITRPIQQLQAGARRIGNGDLAHRLEVRSGDELEQLAAEFNQMAQRLSRARDEERLAVIGRTASSIVHDIQNTLTSIRGYAPLLAEDDLPSDQRREFAAILVESVQRIADMARDLLEFARGEEAKLDLRAMTVDQYLSELRPHLERDFRDASIRIAFDLDCPTPVRLDPARMNRVIFNLAANARDAMGDAGVFTVSSRCERGFAEIRCSDTGPGIAPEMAGRLFQPFVSFGKPYGTGLGLAICKQVVEAHGGTIEARSEAGKGATFIVRLPLVEPEDARGAKIGDAATDG